MNIQVGVEFVSLWSGYKGPPHLRRKAKASKTLSTLTDLKGRTPGYTHFVTRKSCAPPLSKVKRGFLKMVASKRHVGSKENLPMPEEMINVGIQLPANIFSPSF